MEFLTKMPTLTSAKNTIKFILTHPSNSGRRLEALLRAAKFQARGRLIHRRTLARLGTRSVIWADIRRRGSLRILYANPPDFAQMRLWTQTLHPGDLFIDVGANIGGYSIWAAELGAEVLALEPADDTFALLNENVALNGYPIKTIRAAAGSECGSARFTSGQDSLNHFDADGKVEVPVVTIDSIAQDRPIAGMKIDVEGSELQVLHGCHRALADHRIKLIQLEWNELSLSASGTDRQPVAALLRHHGYELCRPDNAGKLLPIPDTAFGEDIFAYPTDRAATPSR